MDRYNPRKYIAKQMDFMTFTEFTYHENCVYYDNCKENIQTHGLIEGVAELKVCRMFGI